MPETLPRQHANSLSARWSIAADNQLRSALEASAAHVVPAAILSGGRITITGPLAVEIAAGTVFWSEHVTVTASEALPFAPLTAAAVNYLWAQVQRNSRDRNVATSVDTWTVAITRTGTATPPSITHIPVAVITCDGSGITAIDECPPGKYSRLAAVFGWSRETVGSDETAAVENGWQAALHRRLEVRGRLFVRGRLVVRE